MKQSTFEIKLARFEVEFKKIDGLDLQQIESFSQFIEKKLTETQRRNFQFAKDEDDEEILDVFKNRDKRKLAEKLDKELPIKVIDKTKKQKI